VLLSLDELCDHPYVNELDLQPIGYEVDDLLPRTLLEDPIGFHGARVKHVRLEECGANEAFVSKVDIQGLGRPHAQAGGRVRASLAAALRQADRQWLADDPQKNADSAMPTRKLSQAAHQASRHRMLRKCNRPP